MRRTVFRMTTPERTRSTLVTRVQLRVVHVKMREQLQGKAGYISLDSSV